MRQAQSLSVCQAPETRLRRGDRQYILTATLKQEQHPYGSAATHPVWVLYAYLAAGFQFMESPISACDEATTFAGTLTSAQAAIPRDILTPVGQQYAQLMYSAPPHPQQVTARQPFLAAVHVAAPAIPACSSR